MKPVVFIFLCLALIGCGQRRAAEVREFPAGYRGWAVIVWGVPGYPQLPTDQGKLVERFPLNGVIITSTKQQFGWADDEEYFVDATGHRLPSRPNGKFGTCGTMTQGNHTMNFEEAFVGTAGELEAAPTDPPLIDEVFKRLYPTVGAAQEPNP